MGEDEMGWGLCVGKIWLICYQILREMELEPCDFSAELIPE